MNALCSTVEKYNARFSIFVDAAYLLRLKELDIEDYQEVCENIKDLEQNGHDIELHFHPQWLYSEYADGKWKMNLDIYKISDMPYEDIFPKFREAKDLLDSIIGRPTIAFRAGGYSLNSFKDYIRLFKENGLLIDSSVIGRNKVDSRFQSYDYNISPKKSCWKFSSDICVEDSNGNVTEYPITSSKKNLGLAYVIKKRAMEKEFGVNNPFGDGQGIGVHMTKYERYKELFNKFIVGKSFAASIDGIMSLNLESVYNQCIAESRSNMVIIGHPKNASLKSISQLDSFLAKTANNNCYTTFKSVVCEKD